MVGIAFIRNRVFEHVNRRFEELYGYQPGEMNGQPTRITYFSDQADQLGRIATTSWGAAKPSFPKSSIVAVTATPSGCA